MFSSTVDNSIYPLANTNDAIADYYLSLTNASPKVYRSDHSYINHIQVDPNLLANCIIPVVIIIKELLRVQIPTTGASIGELIIQDRIDIDSDTFLKDRSKRSLKDHLSFYLAIRLLQEIIVQKEEEKELTYSLVPLGACSLAFGIQVEPTYLNVSWRCACTNTAIQEILQWTPTIKTIIHQF